MENGALEIIEVLYQMIAEAWGVPLGQEKCIIEREKALSLLDELKARLPVEVAEARRLVSARDEFISNARKEADALRRQAEEQARRMVDSQEIVRVARQRSTDMMTSAETKSRELKRVASEYVDDALRRTEEAVAAALDDVRQSRARFRSITGVTAPAPAEPEEEPAAEETAAAAEVVAAPAEDDVPVIDVIL